MRYFRVTSPTAPASRGGERRKVRLAGRWSRWWRPGSAAPPSTDAVTPGTLVFECNICSARNAILMRELSREAGHCIACDATVRSRAIVHHLSLGLFGESLPLARFPERARVLRGIGMSDSHQYAERLARASGYLNTFYHQEPRLDIQTPDVNRFGGCDFVISSDVLEHVAPPIGDAFVGLRRLMKPGALLVLTVPFNLHGDTIEHFPDLHDYRIEDEAGKPVLVNRTREGETQRFRELVFHGGPGATLEMRVFSEQGLRRELEGAGFRDITFHRQPSFEWGIYWAEPWSVPMTAIA